MSTRSDSRPYDPIYRSRSGGSYPEEPNERRRPDEGVEVVLDHGDTRVVDSERPDQNVFRPPRAVRPRAVRASGSFGPPHEYPPHRPYKVPHNPSGSFDEGSYHPQSHYSPHVRYPTAGGRYPPDDVNVISPSHKGDPHYRPPTTPRSRSVPKSYYHYPPTSPVSRPGTTTSPPRLRSYAAPQRSEGPYSAAQRGEYHPDDGTWNSLPPREARPPIVAESSFDSDHYATRSQGSHPTTPSGAPHQRPRADAHQQFYGGGGSWASFDSGPHHPPPHFDDYRYYGYGPPPDSPYSHSAYSGSGYSQYSPQGYYDQYPPRYDRPYEEEEKGMLKDYHPDNDSKANAVVTPQERKKGKSSTPVTSNTTSASGILLPKAAQEVDFEVTDPPTEPVLPPSTEPVCDSPSDVNSYDVLCGRGGGTNSQIGNRRFRKLVQEFQPTYLLARRKEKPLLARTIVLIIRKRGGRFLKKDEETGELYEVGDAKAEAKTSQALREGLDVRATKSAASSLMDKKKKKKTKMAESTIPEEEEEDEEPQQPPAKQEEEPPRAPESPPTLPRLQGEEVKAGMVHPHSPEAMKFRKRRRMRTAGCIPLQDKLFPDFCPPRADLGRPTTPTTNEPMDLSSTPVRRNPSQDEDSIRYDSECHGPPGGGCAGIALDIVTGAASGSFCLGPRRWR